jgi:GNAT superfamily N-acetyltransferase
LLRRGLAPLEVLAARVTGRRGAGPADSPAWHGDGAAGRAGPASEAADENLRIRRAGPADTDAVVRLGREVVRFDTHFGGVNERPDTADALRREVAGLLAGPAPWTWLAERDGTAAGLLCAQRPESAGWITPMVRPVPAAYLMLMFVLPGARGSGVGAALASRLNREIGAAGVAVTLLHYAQLNPLSAPFWNRQGYRPLWTTWEIRPARALR